MAIHNLSGFIKIHQNDKYYVSGVANISQAHKKQLNPNLLTIADHDFRKVRKSPL